ncbi:transposase [Saccharopolyspora shandongensis]|uniref:IS110 family transposase n=1 Tax=Saccharopolyspora shandongensis TaxID=418495 RepID=UPI0033FEFDB4
MRWRSPAASTPTRTPTPQPRSTPQARSWVQPSSPSVPRLRTRLPQAPDLAELPRRPGAGRGRGHRSLGAGLARYLREHDVTVVEIDRPDRKARRWQGKSDLVDAEAAARAALAERRTGTPKFRDGRVEALRALRIARRSAVQQRADVTRQIKTLIITAPKGVRTMLRPPSLHLMLDAFRAERAHPLPVPPLTEDQLRRSMSNLGSGNPHSGY